MLGPVFRSGCLAIFAFWYSTVHNVTKRKGLAALAAKRDLGQEIGEKDVTSWDMRVNPDHRRPPCKIHSVSLKLGLACPW